MIISMPKSFLLHLIKLSKQKINIEILLGSYIIKNSQFNVTNVWYFIVTNGLKYRNGTIVKIIGDVLVNKYFVLNQNEMFKLYMAKLEDFLDI